MIERAIEKSAGVLVAAPKALVRGMNDLFQRGTAPVGAQPGAVALDHTAERTRMRALWVTDELCEREITDVAELETILNAAKLAWVDVRGLRDDDRSRSWNASHGSRGCSLEALKATGGGGLLYCFAAN